jgi:hypothetical protein
MVQCRLAAFLAHDASLPNIWGEHDCATRLADWYSAATGKADPVAGYRGTYASAEECAAKYGKAGVLHLTRKVAAECGLERTKEPVAGDIGIIRFGRSRMMYGGIKVERGWNIQGERGHSKLPDACVRVIAAWRIPQDARSGSSSSCR